MLQRRFDYRALGRLKSGKKTEAKYATYLDGLRCAGEIFFYKFEGVKLRLADKTFYSPDFFVINKDCVVELHEVKGFMRDDAAVKLKVAASQFPMVFKLVRLVKGAWVIEEISGA